MKSRDEHHYYVYILTNWNGKRMYVGATNNLERRIAEHKARQVPGFTQKYNINKLVWFEYGNDINAVIAREKQIKGWLREKKNALVEEINPEWLDLSEDW